MGNDHSRPPDDALVLEAMVRHDDEEHPHEHPIMMNEFDLSLGLLLPLQHAELSIIRHPNHHGNSIDEDPVVDDSTDRQEEEEEEDSVVDPALSSTTSEGVISPNEPQSGPFNMTTTSLEEESHHSHVNLDQVKSAWRAFQGWHLGNKLSLGMSMSLCEINYLTRQMKKLPLYFRPSKLHFWDNSPVIVPTTERTPLRVSHSQRNHDANGSVSSLPTTEPPDTFLGLCQDSVKHVEVHGFGGVPPLERLVTLQQQHRPVDKLLSLQSVRLYHLDLRGGEMGSLLKQMFCFEGSKINTLYMAKCRMDLEMLQVFAAGIATLDRLETLVFVHCSMTDDMLRVLLDNLAKISIGQEERLRLQQQGDVGPVIEAGGRQDNVEMRHVEDNSSTRRNSNEQEALIDRQLHQEEQQAMFGPRAGLAAEQDDEQDDENLERSSPCLDLCVHANDLTVVSISHLADFLSHHDLLRSVTLHANPQIDALLTTDTPSCPQLNYFLEVIQTQNTSLRHFSWHNCKRQAAALLSAHEQSTTIASSPAPSCEFCQQMDVIFRRNRWLALSQKLMYVMDQTPPSVWPLLLVRLQKENNGPHPQRHAVGDDAGPTGKSSHDTPDSASALYAFLMDKYVELVLAPTAKGCSCQTCRIGIGWCLLKELQI